MMSMLTGPEVAAGARVVLDEVDRQLLTLLERDVRTDHIAPAKATGPGPTALFTYLTTKVGAPPAVQSIETAPVIATLRTSEPGRGPGSGPTGAQ